MEAFPVLCRDSQQPTGLNRVLSEEGEKPTRQEFSQVERGVIKNHPVELAVSAFLAGMRMAVLCIPSRPPQALRLDANPGLSR